MLCLLPIRCPITSMFVNILAQRAVMPLLLTTRVMQPGFRRIY